MSFEPQDFQYTFLPGNPNTNSQEDEIGQEQLIDLGQNVGNPQIISQNKKEGENINNTNIEDETTNNRTDDTRNKAFSYPMKSLKSFFKEMFGLDFGRFKCQTVLGSSIRNYKRVLNLEIYQILAYYPENIAKIIRFLQTEKRKNIRLMFLYFMTRTYKEIYKRYINGNIDFPIIPNGTVRICNFMTLQKAITTKDKKGKDKIKNIEEFVELSKSMLNDLETKGRTKEKYVNKTFITIKLEFLEKARGYFNEDALPTSIELEE